MLFSSELKIKSLILDMDGVLWKDTTPIGDLPKIFETIASRNLKVSFATNNATKDVQQYLDKLQGMGIHATADQVINSTLAATMLLTKQFPQGGPVYIIGEDGLHRSLAACGFRHSEENPLAVVVGMDRTLTYDKLFRATIFIRNGVPFYGTNPDKSYPTPEGLAPGAGSILAAIEAASDQSPILAGKPLPTMMEIAMQRMNTTPSETLAVGDRLETDIVGGYNAGCKTALVLSGVSTLEQVNHSSIKPDLIARDLSELIGLS